MMIMMMMMIIIITEKFRLDSGQGLDIFLESLLFLSLLLLS
jgi:hypothetical protein